MSTKKAQAQAIVNQIDAELGISLVSYHVDDLEFLRERLEEFLKLGVDTDDLAEPEETALDGREYGDKAVDDFSNYDHDDDNGFDN